MRRRVYLPRLHQCGTVTGFIAHGFYGSTDLCVRLDDGGAVCVADDDARCGDNVAVFPSLDFRHPLFPGGGGDSGPSAA
jgi:hypothetical protein